jgi:DNA-binding beta-propeller fold protein YncE
MAATVAVLAGASAAGCFPTDRGPAPPTEQLYFPTGLTLSPGGKALFVANSDFDLQYKAGTIQVLDNVRLRALLPKPTRLPPEAFAPGAPLPDGALLQIDCAKFSLAPITGGDSLLYPGPCTPIDLNNPPDGRGSLIKNTVNIGAFAADAVVMRREPDDASDQTREARLLVPVRGDPSLTWVSIDDDSTTAQGEGPQTFRLDCGQSAGTDNRCADAFRAGTDDTENIRQLLMPSEPTSISIGERSDTVLITHQTSGTVSLFLNGWQTPKVEGASPCGKLPSKPTLEFILGGLPTGASGVAALPMPRVARLFPKEIPYSPAFLVTYRSAAEIDVVRYYDDCTAAPSRPFLTLTARSAVSINAGGFDSRDVAIDARPRKACEDACDAADKDCMLGCAGVPIDVFVANRQPASLLLGKATASVSQYGTDDSVRFYDQIPLSQGASKVSVGQIIDRNGVLRPRVFVLCFDARLLYVYDPDARTMEATVTTGRGPSDIVFDTETGAGQGGPNVAYLAHFTDSYIGVIDLDMRNPATYLTFVATVGVPAPPRESK